MVVGKASGKRSLADVMDQDLAAKKKRLENPPHKLTQSRFFAPPILPTAGSASKPSTGGPARDGPMAVAGPSRIFDDKENNIFLDDMEDLEEDLDLDNLSMTAQGVVDADMQVDVEELLDLDLVEQEDGYVSPTPSCSHDTQELSSPIRPGATPEPPDLAIVKEDPDPTDDFDAEIVSSPASAAKPHLRFPHLRPPKSRPLTPVSPEDPFGVILVQESPDAKQAAFAGPDLRDAFGDGDEQTSEIDCFEEEAVQNISGSTSPPTPSPLTPEDTQADFQLLLADPEEQETQANALRNEAVAAGWRDKWALDSKPKPGAVFGLRRRETTFTPTGRQRPQHAPARARAYNPVNSSAVSSKSVARSTVKAKPLQGRRSLTFQGAGNAKSGELNDGRDPSSHGDAPSDTEADETLSRAQIRLLQFRCVTPSLESENQDPAQLSLML